MLPGTSRLTSFSLALNLFLTLAASASWIPNESASAAAQYQNRGPSIAAYELTLGDVLPDTLLAQDQSLNFVNKYFRLVGPAVWPVSSPLVQSLHQVAKTVCSTTRYICHVHIGTNELHPGPCKEECLLQVYPQIDNGDACVACGQANRNIWQNHNLAGLDLNVTVNYTRDSMLIGTTITTFARDITTMLQSHSIQAYAYALMYEPQPIAATIVQYKPLAPLAAKAEAWEMSFVISGGSVVPFGLENEDKLLTTLNALEVSSAFTSFWRFKSIVQDAARNSATVTLVCIRQPDRHGKMGSLAAEAAFKQLERKLINEGTNWRLQFLKARLAPQESFVERFQNTARVNSRRTRSMYLYKWIAPAAISLLVAAVLGLLLLGTPGMVIMPWRTTTYGSDPDSVGTFGSGGRPTMMVLTASGVRKAKALPLIMGDTVEKADIEICKHPSGRGDWLLGTGASGKVFKGVKNGVQEVAVKVLINSDEIQVQMFQEEIRILRSVSFDRNIVQFCGACLQPTDTMMILEYMAGGDLMRAIQSDTKNELRWSRKGGLLMLDIARGLTFLHANKLIHMDLKSKNVLLNGRKDLAKIADVGLSRIIQSTLGGQSSTPFGVGTFEYTAPEILLGRQCNEKVDVYSFGVIMWEVVSHEQPSRGRMRNLKVPQECPVEINSLINVCLSEDPADRPSAKEVYDSLKMWRDKHAANLQTLRERLSSDNSSVQREIVNDSGNTHPSDGKSDGTNHTGLANGSAPSPPTALRSGPATIPSRVPSLPSGVNPLPSESDDQVAEAGFPSSEEGAPSAFMRPSQQAQGFS